MQVLLGTAFDNNNPVVWRLGEKSQENGIYLAMTDSPVPIRFNISDLSTLGEFFIILLEIEDDLKSGFGIPPCQKLQHCLEFGF